MEEAFDIRKIPGDQLVALYGLNFAAAAADGEIDKDELTIIFESLDMTSLTEKQKEKVHGYIICPPSMDETLDTIAKGVDELRFATAVGVIEVLLADDVITNEEGQFLNRICKQLRINEEQREAMINFVKEARRICLNGVDDNGAEKAMKSALSGLSAVGVPIAAVYFSGSVVGLSAAGITSGLAALGLGFGMVPGIGIAIIVGTGIYLSLRWLLGDSKEEKEKELTAERVRKAQLVIKNLQDTINGLFERITSLESKAAEAEANKEAIQVIRKRLNALKRILEQRKNQLVAA
jgi:uncharacterized tellurite resistance protein B-like protein